MLARKFAGLILALTLVGPVSAEVKLDWLQRPTGADVLRFYPKRAAAKGVAGTAILDCDVNLSGALEHCRVAYETPSDEGFGDAALKLSEIFRMNPRTISREGDRRRLVTPVVFALPERPLPDRRYQAGQGAWLIKIGVKKGAPGARPCPEPDKPDQACSDHSIAWAKAPSLMETLPVLDQVDMDGGTSMLLCAVGPQNALKNCAVTPEATPLARSAMLALASLFVAPPRAADGDSVGEGVIAIPFDWSKITPVVRKLKRP
jgi:TonB family protein